MPTIKPNNFNGVEVTIDTNLKGTKMYAYCEKNAEAIEIFKKLHMSWSGIRWNRCLSEYTGDYLNRAGELGNKLLNAGFAITCESDVVLELAANASYFDECSYWIRTYEDLRDTICIKMYERNDVYYEAARKIKGSRWNYDHKCITVPVSNYQEVYDFASDLGFQYSVEANDMIYKYTTRMDEAEKVNVKEHAESTNPLENILNSSDDVLGDLIDD